LLFTDGAEELELLLLLRDTAAGVLLLLLRDDELLLEDTALRVVRVVVLFFTDSERVTDPEREAEDERPELTFDERGERFT
jgi:hypothetical protein